MEGGDCIQSIDEIGMQTAVMLMATVNVSNFVIMLTKLFQLVRSKVSVDFVSAVITLWQK